MTQTQYDPELLAAARERGRQAMQEALLRAQQTNADVPEEQNDQEEREEVGETECDETEESSDDASTADSEEEESSEEEEEEPVVVRKRPAASSKKQPAKKPAKKQVVQKRRAIDDNTRFYLKQKAAKYAERALTERLAAMNLMNIQHQPSTPMPIAPVQAVQPPTMQQDAAVLARARINGQVQKQLGDMLARSIFPA